MHGRLRQNGLLLMFNKECVGVSCWRCWLGLWLALVVALPLFGQGRPDIVWIRNERAGSVDSVSFSPNGALLASAGGNTIQLWRVSDGTLLRTLEGHTQDVHTVSFSPDGALLASGSRDSTIRLWRVSDGTLLRVLEGHTGLVNTVSFSPDGALLASGSWDSTIRLWRVSDGTLLRVLWRHTYQVRSLSFSPDGALLVSGSRDSTIRLWRVSDGTLLQTYDQETGSGVLSVRFLPNGRLFGYGCIDATVVVARNPFWRVGDVNGNGCVDDADLLAVLFMFGCAEGCGVEDINGDGRVDDADLLDVLLNFGGGC